MPTNANDASKGLQVTFLSKDLQTLIDSSSQILISVGYNDQGSPAIFATAMPETAPQTATDSGGKVNGCPYPPGCK